MKKSNTLLALVASIYFSQGLAQAQATEMQKITGLKMPESAIQAKDGRIYISEINEFGKDGDGQISVVGKDGKVTVFATGMDDPKGLAMIGNKLYVADKNRVLEVYPDGTWAVYSAQMAFPSTPVFLNDLVADQASNLYVSDSGTLQSGGQIYKINTKGEVSIVVDSTNPDILAPNGLLMDGKSLLEIDFASGILYRVNLKTGTTAKVAEGFGGGDGLVRTKNGKLIISDWKNGKIYQVVGKNAKLLKEGYQASADIVLSYDGKTLLVPDMKAGELDFVSINKLK